MTENIPPNLGREVTHLRTRLERVEHQNDPWRIFFGILLSVITFLYLLPFGVSLMRNGRNKLAVFLLNLFLGWTFIGWVVALIWAARARE